MDPPSRNPAPSEQKELKSKKGLWFWFNGKLVCCSTGSRSHLSPFRGNFFILLNSGLAWTPKKEPYAPKTCPNVTDDDATISQTRLGKTVKGPKKNKRVGEGHYPKGLVLTPSLFGPIHGKTIQNIQNHLRSAAKDANFPIKVDRSKRGLGLSVDLKPTSRRWISERLTQPGKFWTRRTFVIKFPCLGNPDVVSSSETTSPPAPLRNHVFWLPKFCNPFWRQKWKKRSTISVSSSTGKRRMARKWGNARDPAANSRRWRRTLDTTWSGGCLVDVLPVFVSTTVGESLSRSAGWSIDICGLRIGWVPVCLELPQDAWHITASCFHPSFVICSFSKKKTFQWLFMVPHKRW